MAKVNRLRIRTFQRSASNTLASGQRAWVSNGSVKALDALSVSARTTDEGRTPMLTTDPVHVAQAYNMSSRCRGNKVTF
jgi:hypothetical protein